MAFVIEDGIGRVNANSYVTVAFAKDYATTRGRNEFDSQTDAQIEIWLIRGSEYIDQRWQDDFPGQIKASLQGMQWPRNYAYDVDGNLLTGVPHQVCRAAVEMALRATEVDRLMPDPPPPFPVEDSSGNTSDVNSGEVRSITTQVDTIRRQIVYADSGSRSSSVITSTVIGGTSQPEYPQVKKILEPILIGGGSGSDQIIRN